MSAIPDPLIGMILVGISISIILGLAIYSLIQVVFLGRKRFIIGPRLHKGQDSVLSGADLSRDMTVTQATMTGVGAMIGAGIFVLTGIAAGIAGPGLLVAFAFNGVIATLIAMVYAELGSAMPEAGGGYIWARAGLGERQGFLTGWMSWFAAAVAGSLYALGFAAYFVALLGNLGVNIPTENVFFIEKIIAVIAIILFLVINQFGSSVMGKAEIWISGIKVLVLAFFILTGLIIITSNPTLTSNFSDFFPRGFFSIFTAMGFTFIAFEGYEVVCQAGEEMYDPKTSVPKSIILSILIVIPIYLLVGIVSLGAFTVEGQATWEFLSENKELGLLFAAQQMLPGLGLVVILFGGILSTLSALNAVIFSSTRVAFALARHGSLPQQLAAVSPKTHTPVNSIYTTGLVVILMAILIPIEAVATSADLMFMILFGQVMIASILIRRKVRISKEKLDYGYKTPLFPLIPVLGGIALLIIFYFTLFLHPEALLATLIWLLLGVIIYEAYAHKRIPLKVPSRLAKHARPRADYIPEAFFTTVLNNILVPVRGKAFEWDTIRIAIHIAHEFGPKVTLYHFGFKTEESFRNFTNEFKRFHIPYEVKIVKPLRKNTSPRDIIQHLIEVANTGEYQLAILPSSRGRKFWQISISHNALRKMPIPGIQVFPSKKIEKKMTFEHVGALTPGSKRDPFLLQLGIAMVSSTRIADLVAYHWTYVPKLITPKVMSEAPGVQEDIAMFLHNIGEAIRMGIPIEQRHVLGHDFVRSIADVVKKDQLELLILGYGKPRLGRRPSEKLVKQIECTALIFHGRPFYRIREGSTPSF
ncbi:MAG: APC family permease [Candidatus Hodarchaeota archaeon]